MSKTQRVSLRVLPVTLTLGLLAWVATSIAWQEVWGALASIAPRDLLLPGLLNLAIVALFALRWQIFLRIQGARVPFLRLLGYRLTAFGISYFTPGPHFGGEPYQVYAVTRGHGVSAATSVAAVTLDKLIEMLINFAVLAAGVVVLVWNRGEPAAWLERQLLVAALLLLLLPCLQLVALYAGRRPLSALVRWAGGVVRRPLQDAGWAKSLAHSEEQAGWICRVHPQAVIWAVVTTLVAWVGIVIEFWLLIRVLGVMLGPVQVVTALVAARVAILLPLPAGLGALEASQALAMQSVGVDLSIGVALALMIRARDVVMGLTGLALGGVDVWATAAQARASLPPTAGPEPLHESAVAPGGTPVAEPPPLP